MVDFASYQEQRKVRPTYEEASFDSIYNRPQKHQYKNIRILQIHTVI